MLDYPVQLTPDGDTLLVTFPDVPEAITFGVDYDDAMHQAIDALESGLSFYVDNRKPLPKPSTRPDLPSVCPSPLEAIKLGLYQEMTSQGIRKTELARRLGWKSPQIDRLFDLTHASKLEQLEAAARALGKAIEVNLKATPE